MDWIPVYRSYFVHPKTRRLERLLGKAGIYTPIQLWAWASDCRPDGNLEGLDAYDIAEATGWPTDDRDRLLAALVSCGFVEADEAGRPLRIHDWQDHTGAHLARMQKGTEKVKAWRARQKHQNIEKYNEKMRHGTDKETTVTVTQPLPGGAVTVTQPLPEPLVTDKRRGEERRGYTDPETSAAALPAEPKEPEAEPDQNPEPQAAPLRLRSQPKKPAANGHAFDAALEVWSAAWNLRFPEAVAAGHAYQPSGPDRKQYGRRFRSLTPEQAAAEPARMSAWLAAAPAWQIDNGCALVDYCSRPNVAAAPRVGISGPSGSRAAALATVPTLPDRMRWKKTR